MPELDRRDFLKLVGVGAGAAATGCSDPVEKLVPYVVQPQSITPGISVNYASTCTECPAGCGLHVKTREGRPIKLEGNPDHPINRGKLCARGQASLGRAYHPDRHAGPMKRGASGQLEATTWDAVQAELIGKLQASKGSTVILGGPVGPTLDAVIARFTEIVGARQRIVYEPFAYEALRAGTKSALGVATLPIFDVGQADLIIDLGSDFIDTGLSPTENARQFADARDLKKHADGGTRLVSVVPRLDLTTTKGDKWLPARAGSQGDVAMALARAVLDRRGVPAGADAEAVQKFVGGTTTASAAAAADIPLADLDALVDQLLNAKRPVVLPPGVAHTASNATETAAAVMLLNAMLGAIGTIVTIPPPSDRPAPATMVEMQALVEDMKAGRVPLLLIHDSDPAYSLPGFADALTNVATVVSFSSLDDQTSSRAHLLLPDHSPMETWGDAEPRPGVRSIIQPTLRPLLDTQAIGDTFLSLGRAAGGAMPEGSFRQVLESAWSGVDWRETLGRGGVFGGTPGATLVIGQGIGDLSFASAKLDGPGSHALIAFPHSFLGDGRSASLPWMQEIPDPVTKIEWNSWIEMSFATAESLGVGFGDVVSVATSSGTVEGSVFPRGGIRDDAIAIPIGQGHTVGQFASMANDGAPGVARGINVMPVLTTATGTGGSRIWLGSNAKLSPTGKFRRIALSQWTDNQRGRGLAPQITLTGLAASGEGQGGEHGGGHGGHHDEPPHTFTPAFDARPGQPYRWGMTIDNDRCNGCSACVAACYIENNVAVVGETQAIQHREMSWLRIERYVGEGNLEGGAERRPIPDREKLGELDVRHLPLPCQHCGAAPCESVCPTLATYHTIEGINGMVYNRCAGTRYCANNCSYKVRRFNYWDYGNRNFPGMLGLMLNPDVTVRGQGVMEKCSFCVQRIEAARQPAKDQKREIRDGEVVTACQQSCPTNAITFGNLRDAASAASKASDDPKRAYHVLRMLNLRPAITYLAQVKRDEHEGSL